VSQAENANGIARRRIINVSFNMGALVGE